MTTPRAALPTLRAFLGAIACRKTTTTSAKLGLYSLEGALSEADQAVQDVVNAIIAALEDRVATREGAASIAISGGAGTQTLLTADLAKRFLTLTGTLALATKSTQVTSTDGDDWWVVLNEAGGPIEVDLKTNIDNGNPNPVTIPTDAGGILWCDGTAFHFGEFFITS